MKRTPLRLALISTGIIVSLSGCSTLSDMMTPKKIDYQSAKQLPTLELPPDMTAPTIDTHFDVTGAGAKGATTYSAYSAAHEAKTSSGTDCGAGASTVLPGSDNIKLEHAGSERWLVIKQTPDKVWSLIQAFWQKNGFAISYSDPATGIMQTNWVVHPVGQPQNAANAPAQANDNLSASERDSYRTRLERNAANPALTEIYISHRGMIRASSTPNHPAAWQISPPNPEPEAEMLSRLMVDLGLDKTRADALLGQHSGPDRATIGQSKDGKTILIDNEPFTLAWQRVGLALDRVGFSVVTSDPINGVYKVHYLDAGQNGAKSDKHSFLSSLEFWKSHTKADRDLYQITLAENPAATNTEIHVLDSKGQAAPAAVVDKILDPLLAQLK